MREERAGYAGRIDTDPDTDGDPEGEETVPNIMLQRTRLKDARR